MTMTWRPSLTNVSRSRATDRPPNTLTLNHDKKPQRFTPVRVVKWDVENLDELHDDDVAAVLDKRLEEPSHEPSS